MLRPRRGPERSMSSFPREAGDAPNEGFVDERAESDGGGREGAEPDGSPGLGDKRPDPVFGQWFAEAGSPARNPIALSRMAMKPPLPKRFYTSVDIGEADGSFHLLLDQRPARTPGKNLLAMPSARAAALLAAEWEAQRTLIDPAVMHVTRIANSAIDHVSHARLAVIDEIVRYAGSDVICYRAGDPRALVARQTLVWDPIVDWAREDLGIRLNLAEGVMFVAQPAQSVERLRDIVLGFTDPLALSALHVITTIGGSLLLALAVERGRLSASEGYDASDLEADFTAEVWGEDAEAAERRRLRKIEFEAAAALLLALKSPI